MMYQVSEKFLLELYEESDESWKEAIEKEVPELFKNQKPCG